MHPHRENGKKYITNPRDCGGKDSPSKKCRRQAAPCFYIEACLWEVTRLFIYASKPSCTWDFRVHHFPSVSFVSVSASSFAISGGNSPKAVLILLHTSLRQTDDIRPRLDEYIRPMQPPQSDLRICSTTRLRSWLLLAKHPFFAPYQFLTFVLGQAVTVSFEHIPAMLTLFLVKHLQQELSIRRLQTRRPPRSVF